MTDPNIDPHIVATDMIKSPIPRSRRKSYEVVGWSYNGALYCVDHVPSASARDLSDLLDPPQPVILDEITSHDVCDFCFIPLDA